MTVGIACPDCRYLIGVAGENIKITQPVEESRAGAGVLRRAINCPQCKAVTFTGATVDVIVPELIGDGKRRVSVK